MTMFDFLGPGMTGPEVEEIQKIIGVPITGIYDETTRDRVRGLQILHEMPMTDGIVDDDFRDLMRKGISRSRR